MANLSANQQRFLDLLVAREALRFGSFTLKSGRISPYFVNTGCFHTGGDLDVLGEIYASSIAAALGADTTSSIDAIFGPAYKGIPLALATASAAERAWGRPVPWVYDRKEAKDHGDGGWLVGAPIAAGSKVVVVDDVLTAGTALRETIAKLRPAGVEVVAAVVSVDRQEPGPDGSTAASAAITADTGVPVHAVITIGEAVTALTASGQLDDEQADTIRARLASLGS